ncbi:MAG: TIGR01777 family oxidoreductase [Halioglobus sp.]
MHILITGGTGFIGSELVKLLLQQDHTVTVMSRQDRASDGACDYITNLDTIDDSATVDAVINLAGASLAERRWTSVYKTELVASRIDTTRDIVSLCTRLKRPPKVLLSASAIGYYGPFDDTRLDETVPAGNTFSAQLCEQWELEARTAEALGVRVCCLRLGVVLDRDGGAMNKMSQPFRFGLANWIGSGEQWLSWVHRQDVLAAIAWLLASDTASGAYNVTAPEPVTSKGFCKSMQQHHRTVLTLPMPATLMRALMGEMAEELLISGQRVVPNRLLSEGFSFRFPTIDKALSAINS